jgi:chitinase
MPLECAPLQRDINYCQKSTNKKILISLGGQSGGYALNNAADGVYLANWLWGAYGPYNQTWVDNGGIRPLDRGFDNKTLTDTVDVDGFDFDIEHTSAGKTARPYKRID